MEFKSVFSIPSNVASNPTINKKKKSNIVSCASHKIVSPSLPSASSNMRRHIQVGSKGTLWEREEYTVRFFLEESKVNMLLRFLVEFKKEQKKLIDGTVITSDVAKLLQLDEHMLDSKMRCFEESLGILLKHCLMAVEVLQTLDINQLIEYASDVINLALSEQFIVPDPESFSKSQEFLAIIYLGRLGEEAEHLQEEGICRKLAESNVLGKIIEFLGKFQTNLDTEDLFDASKSVSSILNLEYFHSNRDTVFSDDQKKILTSLYDSVFKTLLTDYESKKALRALVDTVNRIKCTI